MNKNNELARFALRQQIINLIRTFFNKEGFLEVETPILVKAPDTAPFNEVFETETLQKTNNTRHSTNNIKGYLTPSPEFFMKKLLAQGYKNIFQICKAFRNNFEGNSPLHNLEFTIMEWYRTNADYTDIMIDSENLINFIYDSLFNKTQNSKVPPSVASGDLRWASKTQNRNLKLKTLKYQNKLIDLNPPWLRLSLKQVFKNYAGINLDEFLDLKEAKEIALKKGYRIEKDTTWEQIYHQIFLNEVEPEINNLKKPVILYDYPAPLAALSKRKKNDLRYAERFELYIAGLELGNAFSELTDWQEQEQRLKNDITERKRLKMKVFDYDHDFISSLKIGFPPTGGIAIGIDRLVMLFTDAKSIHEVIFFPASQIFSKSQF